MPGYRAIVDPTRWVATLSLDADVLYPASRVLSDGATGTGVIVFQQSPTIVTPTIASFTNAQHTHQNAAGGGTRDAAAIASGTLPIARGGTGNTTGTATTNANLTGPITSVGNATSIASQTGTGSKFVVDTSPTIITPTIASFVNATHNHESAAGGGTLAAAALALTWTTRTFAAGNYTGNGAR